MSDHEVSGSKTHAAAKRQVPMPEPAPPGQAPEAIETSPVAPLAAETAALEPDQIAGMVERCRQRLAQPGYGYLAPFAAPVLAQLDDREAAGRERLLSRLLAMLAVSHTPDGGGLSEVKQASNRYHGELGARAAAALRAVKPVSGGATKASWEATAAVARQVERDTNLLLEDGVFLTIDLGTAEQAERGEVSVTMTIAPNDWWSKLLLLLFGDDDAWKEVRQVEQDTTKKATTETPKEHHQHKTGYLWSWVPSLGLRSAYNFFSGAKTADAESSVAQFARGKIIAALEDKLDTSVELDGFKVDAVTGMVKIAAVRSGPMRMVAGGYEIVIGGLTITGLEVEFAVMDLYRLAVSHGDMAHPLTIRFTSLVLPAVRLTPQKADPTAKAAKGKAAQGGDGGGGKLKRLADALKLGLHVGSLDLDILEEHDDGAYTIGVTARAGALLTKLDHRFWTALEQASGKTITGKAIIVGDDTLSVAELLASLDEVCTEMVGTMPIYSPENGEAYLDPIRQALADPALSPDDLADLKAALAFLGGDEGALGNRTLDRDKAKAKAKVDGRERAAARAGELGLVGRKPSEPRGTLSLRGIDAAVVGSQASGAKETRGRVGIAAIVGGGLHHESETSETTVESLSIKGVKASMVGDDVGVQLGGAHLGGLEQVSPARDDGTPLRAGTAKSLDLTGTTIATSLGSGSGKASPVKAQVDRLEATGLEGMQGPTEDRATVSSGKVGRVRLDRAETVATEDGTAEARLGRLGITGVRAKQQGDQGGDAPTEQHWQHQTDHAEIGHLEVGGAHLTDTRAPHGKSVGFEGLRIDGIRADQQIDSDRHGYRAKVAQLDHDRAMAAAKAAHDVAVREAVDAAEHATTQLIAKKKPQAKHDKAKQTIEDAAAKAIVKAKAAWEKAAKAADAERAKVLARHADGATKESSKGVSAARKHREHHLAVGQVTGERVGVELSGIDGDTPHVDHAALGAIGVGHATLSRTRRDDPAHMVVDVEQITVDLGDRRDGTISVTATTGEHMLEDVLGKKTGKVADAATGLDDNRLDLRANVHGGVIQLDTLTLQSDKNAIRRKIVKAALARIHVGGDHADKTLGEAPPHLHLPVVGDQQVEQLGLGKVHTPDKPVLIGRRTFGGRGGINLQNLLESGLQAAIDGAVRDAEGEAQPKLAPLEGTRVQTGRLRVDKVSVDRETGAEPEHQPVDTTTLRVGDASLRGTKARFGKLSLVEQLFEAIRGGKAGGQPGGPGKDEGEDDDKAPRGKGTGKDDSAKGSDRPKRKPALERKGPAPKPLEGYKDDARDDAHDDARDGARARGRGLVRARGPGDIEHVDSSCYLAAILNLFAVNPTYLALLDPLQNPPANQRMTWMQNALHHLAVAVQAGQAVNGGQMAYAIAVLGNLGFLANSGAIQARFAQQDAAEVFSQVLATLDAGGAHAVGVRRTTVRTPNDPTQAQTTTHTQLALPASASHVLNVGVPDHVDSLQAAIDADYGTAHHPAVHGATIAQTDRISPLPQTLTIALNHATHGHAIDIPQVLVVPVAALHGAVAPVRYRLTGFVVHQGGGSGGHYVASVEQHGEWHRNDDMGGPARGQRRPDHNDLDRARLLTYERLP